MKNKTILRMLCMTMCFVSVFFACGKTDSEYPNQEDSARISTKNDYPLLSSSEIWNGVEESPSSETANIRLNAFASMQKSIYIKWDTVWREVSGDSVLTLCRDPLCSHNSPTCLNLLASPSNAIYRYGDNLFFLGEGNGAGNQNFICYSLTNAKADVIAKYDTGGQMIGRLGNYLYYFTLRFDEPDESGHAKTWRQIYRYHIRC